MRGLPREGGEVIIETTGPEFSVWRGEVQFGDELDALFADLMMRVFEERYAVEGDDDGDGE